MDHTWVEEKVALEASRVETSSRVDGLALELVQAKAYIYSTLSMEYGREGDVLNELQLAFCRLQTEPVKREEALKVTIAEMGTL